MTLIIAAITHKDPNFIMETQLLDDSPFLYEWKTAEQDLEFLDYAYCFEDNQNKRKASKASSSTTTLSLLDTDGIINSDEKQTILNLSLDKLKRIEDPETCLCRTVLISNTIKRLRSPNELRILNKDTPSSCCFAGTLPCKRPRLQVTDLLNSNHLKSDYTDVGLITKQETPKEILRNQRINPADNQMFHIPLNRATADETKRNCEPVKFNGIELPNVICVLET